MIGNILNNLTEKNILEVNDENSTLAVSCVAPGKCEFRFTTMCQRCKKNLGCKQEKNYYESKTN